MNTLLSLFRSDSSIAFEISLRDEKSRATYPLELSNGMCYAYPIYTNVEDLKGRVNIKVPKRMRLDHAGITAELVGSVMEFTQGNVTEFVKEVRKISPSGTITGKKMFKFSFKNVVKKYESYYGINARVRYAIRIVAAKSFGTSLVEELDVWIIRKEKEPKKNEQIKLEVGITDWVHIEFEYPKSKYSLRDILIGTVNFKMANVRIMHMDIEIVRKETLLKSGAESVDSEVVVKYEVMHGMPSKNESIPVRIHLKPLSITPTYVNVEDVFSVRYFLNLVIVDSEERRFFKQQEITIWRDSDNANDYILPPFGVAA